MRKCSTRTSWMMLAAMGILAGLSNAPAAATLSMQHTYRSGIDLGYDPATGCDLSLGSVAPNSLPGFELQVTVVVDADLMPPQVVSAQIETCSGDGGSFGSAQPLPGFVLEIDSGLLGSDSVVGAIPRSLLGDTVVVRLAHHALSGDGSEDALFTRDGTPDGAAITVAIGRPAPAPVLSALGIALAVLLLFGVGLTQWRRGGWAAAAVLIFVASAAAIAYAAFGDPAAVDDPADASPPDTRAEIVASFVMATDSELGLRLDIEDIDATCSDGKQNQDETDVDCGGSTCAACSAGSSCGGGSDCASGVCTASICQDPCAGKADGETCDAGMIQLDECQTTRCDAGVCLVELRPEGALCRAGSGDQCDLDEVCDGESPSCPPDVYEDDTHVCRTGSGDSCDPDEKCPGQAGVPCPPDHVEAGGQLCRPGSGDICDPDETCTGVAGEICPSDQHRAAGFVCNQGSGDICDPDETCSGVPGEACPADRFAVNDATSTTVCHIASAFPVSCRESASCSGVPDEPCPVTYKSASTVCRAGDDGTCDPPEYCTGSSAECPPDLRNKAEGEVCRPAEGTCDIAEECEYDPFAGGSCPPDETKPIGASCRSGSACDPAEVCEEGPDGKPSCPADVTLDDGTLCSPNVFCSNLGECKNGSCVQTGCTAGDFINCECPGIDVCDVPEDDSHGTCVACDGVSCGAGANGCGCNNGDYCDSSGVCQACGGLGEGECVDSCCPSGNTCARIDSTSAVCLPSRSDVLCVSDCFASDTLGDSCTPTHSEEGRAYSDDCDCLDTCYEGKCDGAHGAAIREQLGCVLPPPVDTDCDGVANGADPCPLQANDCCLGVLTGGPADVFIFTICPNNDECP